ncbi:MAG: hypothetical protein GY796_30340, partial [Chloroflexi bacterium]|nr:hypothetical protein [Chloroflexota bacterium]
MILTLLGSMAFQESEGLVVMEAEHGQRTNGATHNWLYVSALTGYTGTSYLQPSLDNNTLISTDSLTTSPRLDYPLNITRPATYTIWLRGYAPDAAGDSAYIQLAGTTLTVTNFIDRAWSWANGGLATIPIEQAGTYTLSLLMREDGLRID